ncbi:PTS galactosamine/N-acetylgalactosamine transporter subunit IIA [[Ruminococcus] torques]|jgi:PTS system N-acetylgalactosamine-specific IIA component|uniref:PTS galactosamine/N-acetylgalactosamine transporter subunit IIA n=1 Tax=[Ruminococcus] torques TaxID=33039 RepID=UPI0015BDAB50|nr:PTS galactosamine/N-acetylgalactosamine transporter subunit IIA [[Ruminococcus] torques]MBS5399638.1 PTS sugar transporter subunit IIA [Lachnospiraceae bacterium]MDM8236823.1 PTS galactosamine/N-acetylgalactosamine transporter subunit IIA [[Ruminococcus] torques]HJC81406.1 PTS sugar transporter subunit IIA [Candidatus Mediterraneibacter excrementipullorum]
MIGLLVTGHANFGTGITSSVNLIAGEQEAYKAVDFLPTYSTEDLTREITKALDELKDCEGVIIFTDLMGGTPFNVSAQIGHGKENIRIVAGTNLPMLVEIVMSRKFMDNLDELVDSVLETGKEQVTKYEFKQVVQEASDDGI